MNESQKRDLVAVAARLYKLSEEDRREVVLCLMYVLLPFALENKGFNSFLSEMRDVFMGIEHEHKALNPLSIDVLGLNIRTTNALKAEGVMTIGELTALTEEGVIKMPNLGKKSVREIKEKLQGRGLMLRIRP